MMMKLNIDRVDDDVDLKIEVRVVKDHRENHDNNELMSELMIVRR